MNATRVRCEECKGRVGGKGLLRAKGYPENLCYRCWTTPYEIRKREINGCMSRHFIPTAEQVAADEAQKAAEAHAKRETEVSREARFYAAGRRRSFGLVKS